MSRNTEPKRIHPGTGGGQPGAARAPGGEVPWPDTPRGKLTRPLTDQQLIELSDGVDPQLVARRG